MSTIDRTDSRVEDRFPDAVPSKAGVVGVSVAAFVLAMLLLFGTIVASFVVVVLLGTAAGVTTGDVEVARTIGEFIWIGLVVAYLTWVPIVWAIVWFFDLPFGVSLPDLEGIAASAAAFLVLTGLSVGSTIYFSTTGLRQVPAETPGSAGVVVAGGLLLAFVVGAVVEELLFRGAIQGLLRDQFSAAAAIVGANVLFVPIHVLNNLGQPPVVAVTNLAVILLLGLVVGALYERYGTIVLPAVVHAAYNAVVLGAAFLLL